MADDNEQRESAQRMLSIVMDEFEKRFSHVVPYDNLIGKYESITGETFVEITNVFGSCMSLTADHAIDEWLAKINEYATGRKGTIYWRIPPEIDFYDFKLREEWMYGGKIRIWKVYASVLISDLPPKRTSIQKNKDAGAS